ncbi:hypothetical protein PAECIP111891_02115 [Paenibacillus allorhizoplanae]|uniref:Uncharacterized protein n=1 Tax=Paenibacillus allorhizoplanae TaxID=2905648 RepID=A0ABN8GBM2_9BACL|nr:hypothetical protein [Paenibacillus allorhizoplanae]CAH1202286.1 hypothetical protein PAECIP111891_02115 [Paenibacillus allorhizoplanae]
MEAVKLIAKPVVGTLIHKVILLITHFVYGTKICLLPGFVCTE